MNAHQRPLQSMDWSRGTQSDPLTLQPHPIAPTPHSAPSPTSHPPLFAERSEIVPHILDWAPGTGGPSSTPRGLGAPPAGPGRGSAGRRRGGRRSGAPPPAPHAAVAPPPGRPGPSQRQREGQGRGGRELSSSHGCHSAGGACARSP